jgi:hypothetical protein|tara:strand:+ start:330 stop:605 length:276 start_codon:yes stop_codon:yes gene_type:complete
MINKANRASIKSVIGYRYAPLIQKELIDSNEFNKDGKPYSTGHIANVMNGEKHKIIEAAIYRVVKKCLKIQKKRGFLINKKNADVTAISKL